MVALQLKSLSTLLDKPTYIPDGGDYVVVINAEKAVVTGDKERAKDITDTAVSRVASKTHYLKSLNESLKMKACS